MKLVTTSIVRGSRQGESHGGAYLIDLDRQAVERTIDWNRADMNWRGQSGDRGLRGIAFDGRTLYIAASDELCSYTPDFTLIESFRNRYLKYCHEIAVYQRTLYLASTGFDSILGFDLDSRKFTWGMYVGSQDYRFAGQRFDPLGDDGPLALDKLHLNNVFCDEHGMYIGGSRTGGMLHFNGKTIRMAAELPPGCHNARPFRDGVLFNDSDARALRYAGRGEGGEDRVMRVPTYDPGTLTGADEDENEPGATRQGFARGLCLVSDSMVAGGSSPATVSVYDLAANQQLLSVNLTRDLRNTIHSLAVWPYD